jgi:hypothetical protein
MIHSVAEGGAKVVDRMLIAGTAVLMLTTAWLPWTGDLPGSGVQILATLAAGCVLIGGFAVGRGTRPAFTLLWASLGISLALAVLGIYSIGLLYILASILIVSAIMATPNHSQLPSRFDPRYVWITPIVLAIVIAAVIGAVI